MDTKISYKIKLIRFRHHSVEEEQVIISFSPAKVNGIGIWLNKEKKKTKNSK
jgi:hypothetical protein